MIVTRVTPTPDELHPLGPLYDAPLPVGLLHQPREEGVGVGSPDPATLPVRATAAVRQRELEHVSRVSITCHVGHGSQDAHLVQEQHLSPPPGQLVGSRGSVDPFK